MTNPYSEIHAVLWVNEPSAVSLRLSHSLAEVAHVVALLQPELGHGHGHRDLPALADRVERGSQLSDKLTERILVREAPAAVSSAGVLPVNVQTVELVLVHELCRGAK